MKHPHADEHPKKPPTTAEQLEGASLFEVVDDDGPWVEVPRGPDRETGIVRRDDVPAGPHRVGRRSMTQDRAHAKAMDHAPNMREAIYEHLVAILPRGQTREAIHDATGFKLQTVCGRVNDLLTWEVDGQPVPRVREGAVVNGAALVYAIPGRSLSQLSPSRATP